MDFIFIMLGVTKKWRMLPITPTEIKISIKKWQKEVLYLNSATYEIYADYIKCMQINNTVKLCVSLFW